MKENISKSKEQDSEQHFDELHHSSNAEFEDNRPSTTIQRQLQEDNRTQKAQITSSKPNNTGLPDRLKNGVEQLSGYAMDDVKVHYNSPKPAQLQAQAYAQGTDIHLAPGQEKHLPHEAWHVVQQKQSRVQPTLQMKSGVNVNNDVGLEREADVMGRRAMSNDSQEKFDLENSITSNYEVLQLMRNHDMDGKPLKGKLKQDGFEINLSRVITNTITEELPNGVNTIQIKQLDNLYTELRRILIVAGWDRPQDIRSNNYELNVGTHELNWAKGDGTLLFSVKVIIKPHNGTEQDVRQADLAHQNLVKGVTFAQLFAQGTFLQNHLLNNQPDDQYAVQQVLDSSDNRTPPKPNTLVVPTLAQQQNLVQEYKMLSLTNQYSNKHHYVTKDQYTIYDLHPATLKVRKYQSQFQYAVLHDPASHLWKIHHYEGTINPGEPIAQFDPSSQWLQTTTLAKDSQKFGKRLHGVGGVKALSERKKELEEKSKNSQIASTSSVSIPSMGEPVSERMKKFKK